MSHQEQATLENANICKSMLNDAITRMEDTVKAVKHTMDTSTSLVDDVLTQMYSDLVSEKKRLVGLINDKKNDIGNAAYSAELGETRRFLYQLNTVTLKANALNSAISEALTDKLMEGSIKMCGIDDYLESIEDAKVRRMVSLLSKNPKHQSLSLEELRSLAESKLDPSKRVDRRLLKDAIDDASKMMADAKVSEDSATKVVAVRDDTSPLEIVEKATDEVVDETLRRSAVQAIVKSISSRGFVVQRGNIKHLKDEDVVLIIAQKPGGQTAEFRIDINGKFMYHFQGYEGKACEKDIGPMERDLEEVYGIKLVDRKTIWENPDKNMNMYHKEMKVRRDS